MATSQSTTNFILDQLSSVPKVRVRKMFGEYALCCEDKVVALICDHQLLVKITPAGKAVVGRRYAKGIAHPGAKPSCWSPRLIWKTTSGSRSSSS